MPRCVRHPVEQVSSWPPPRKPSSASSCQFRTTSVFPGRRSSVSFPESITFNDKRQIASGAGLARPSSAPSGHLLPAGGEKGHPLEDVLAEVLVLQEFAEVAVDVGAVDGDALAAAVGGLVAEGVEQALEHGVQATGTDVLLALVDLGGDVGQAVDGVGR